MTGTPLSLTPTSPPGVGDPLAFFQGDGFDTIGDVWGMFSDGDSSVAGLSDPFAAFFAEQGLPVEQPPVRPEPVITLSELATVIREHTNREQAQHAARPSRHALPTQAPVRRGRKGPKTGDLFGALKEGVEARPLPQSAAPKPGTNSGPRFPDPALLAAALATDGRAPSKPARAPRRPKKAPVAVRAGGNVGAPSKAPGAFVSGSLFDGFDSPPSGAPLVDVGVAPVPRPETAPALPTVDVATVAPAPPPPEGATVPEGPPVAGVVPEGCAVQDYKSAASDDLVDFAVDVSETPVVDDQTSPAEDMASSVVPAVAPPPTALSPSPSPVARPVSARSRSFVPLPASAAPVDPVTPGGGAGVGVPAQQEAVERAAQALVRSAPADTRTPEHKALEALLPAGRTVDPDVAEITARIHERRQEEARHGHPQSLRGAHGGQRRAAPTTPVPTTPVVGDQDDLVEFFSEGGEWWEE